VVDVCNDGNVAHIITRHLVTCSRGWGGCGGGQEGEGGEGREQRCVSVQPGQYEKRMSALSCVTSSPAAGAGGAARGGGGGGETGGGVSV
jgi:hypothetical protein